MIFNGLPFTLLILSGLLGVDAAALLQEKLARARAMRPDCTATTQRSDSAKENTVASAAEKVEGPKTEPQSKAEVQSSNSEGGESQSVESIPVTLIQVRSESYGDKFGPKPLISTHVRSFAIFRPYKRSRSINRELSLDSLFRLAAKHVNFASDHRSRCEQNANKAQKIGLSTPNIRNIHQHDSSDSILRLPPSLSVTSHRLSRAAGRRPKAPIH